MDIKELRNEIDSIDAELVRLYIKRMDVAAHVAEYKRGRGMPVYDAERERQLLEKVGGQAGARFAGGVQAVFSCIMEQSRAYQRELLLRCGLLGEKLTHSFSPQIHKMLSGCDYSLFSVPPEELERFIRGEAWDCLNVTIPYKEAVIKFLDDLSGEARRIGAVNTITRTEDGRLIGDNTDYYGFTELVRASGIDAAGKKCVILGSGGASKTVRCALEDMGAREIVVISRRGADNYENIQRHYDADIIVNATPVGMYPENGKSAVELGGFERLTGVIDLIYNPAKTKLLLDAEERGIPYANGLYMLAAQAKRARELFTGRQISDSETARVCRELTRESLNIVLIGMPGCGKSSVGSRLRELTGRELIDTDELIARGGRTPERIIVEDGEEAFRLEETEAVREAGKRTGVIIATGGGAVTRRENLRPLRQNGVVFFINRPAHELTDEGRPISQSVGTQKLYEERLPLYRAFCDEETAWRGTDTDTAKFILERFGALI